MSRLVSALRRGAAVTLSIASAVGFAVGLRAIVALELPRVPVLLRPPAMSTETLGISWTDAAVFPAMARSAAVAGLVRTIAALLFAALAAAALNAVILLAESSGNRRQELAIRSALGSPPRRMVTSLLRELRTRLFAGLAMGLLAGVGAGAVLRATWPHGTAAVSTGALGPLPLDLLAALALVVLVEVAAHLSGTRRLARPGRLAAALRSGGRVTSEPAEIFVRRSLAAGHVTVSATIVIAALTLTSAVDQARGVTADSPGSEGLFVSTLRGGSAWSEARRTVSAVPGIEAESLSAPGALLGLGIRDVAIAECGNCSRGLFPAPLWNTLADHHAVGGDYFRLRGLEVAEGRSFTEADATASERVALVNRRMADTAFEDGRPIGKRVRLGTGEGPWYTVIGIVEDHPEAGLGTEARAREAIYVDLARNAPETARLLMRGTPEAAAEAVRRLEAEGWEATPPVDYGRWRSTENASLGWARSVARVVGALVLLLGLFGIRLVAEQTGRRRVRDLAIRRAIGASGRSLAATLLTERMRTTGWGLAGYALIGTGVAAFVEQASGATPPPLPVWLGLGAVIFMASVGASVSSLRLVRAADPAELLD